MKLEAYISYFSQYNIIFEKFLKTLLENSVALSRTHVLWQRAIHSKVEFIFSNFLYKMFLKMYLRNSTSEG